MQEAQFQEVSLRDFRCFHEQQTVRMAPLTLLVGENSTGKTSFLAAVRAVWETAYGSGDPDFRQAPYDLGSFQEILYDPGNHRGGPTSFSLGFRSMSSKGFLSASKALLSSGLHTTDIPLPLLDFEATFQPRAATPYPAITAWRDREYSVEYHRSKNADAQFVLNSPNGSWHHPIPAIYHGFPEIFSYVLVKDWMGSIEGPENKPVQEDQDTFRHLLDQFSRNNALESPFAGAPIRSSPRRTYEPIRPIRDPEGDYVPTFLANVHLGDPGQWSLLRERLEDFGHRSGLFDEISVTQLKPTQGGPFQLEIRKFGKRRKGSKRNLIDVGYGVSQALPVLVELFRGDGPSMVLLQQPEVHLHPSAQAALGSLFCEIAASGRQIVAETHSEYILDRIRMDIRDCRTTLKSDQVSILFFERSGLDVLVHCLRFDAQGNVPDAPGAYGRFFFDETKRSIGL